MISKIHLINVYGKPVKFEAPKIKTALSRGVPEMMGESHVWANDPIMVCIYKTRKTKRGPFTYTIVEIDETSQGELEDVLELQFPEEEIDAAIKFFIWLCSNPKKKLQRSVIKKLGGSVIIFPTNTAMARTAGHCQSV